MVEKDRAVVRQPGTKAMADVRAAEVRVQLPTAPQRRFGLRAHDCTNLADTPSQPNKARTRRKAGHRAGGRPPSKKAKSAAKAKALERSLTQKLPNLSLRLFGMRHLDDSLDFARIHEELSIPTYGTEVPSIFAEKV